MSKGWKITTIVVASVLLVIFAVVGVYYLWPWNRAFFDNADKEFEIPGLDTSFVPQGMDKIDNQNKYIISGYMSDGSPSRFYVYDKENNQTKYFTLKTGDGDYCGHAGGIASAGRTLWTVGDNLCLRFSLSSVDSVENGGSITVLDTFTSLNGCDFVFDHDGMLWIGEFYKEGKYETELVHRLKTTSGEENPALVYGYPIDESKSHGLLTKTPQKLLSIRGLCQGMAIDSKGNFILSTSYSLPDSNIYYYKNVFDKECDMEFALGNSLLPLWFLDNNNLISTTNAPSMSEEIFVENDRVYILFESNCKKYRLFNRKRVKNVYSLPISNLNK